MLVRYWHIDKAPATDVKLSAMPRSRRHDFGGVVYHVINRGAARRTLFVDDTDYQAFVGVLEQALAVRPMRLLAYCIMPTHWHLVLWPREDGQLGRFMQWLGTTHVRRWLKYRSLTGTGHVYQGRYKCFPIECDEHFLTVCRYVERNPPRAGLVARAEAWRWSSLATRLQPGPGLSEWLAEWPVKAPSNWLERVNSAETSAELAELVSCMRRNQPYGRDSWVAGLADGHRLAARS